MPEPTQPCECGHKWIDHQHLDGGRGCRILLSASERCPCERYKAMPERKVHFVLLRRPWEKRVACGGPTWLADASYSTDPTRATCGSCRRTRAWSDAQARAWRERVSREFPRTAGEGEP